MSRLQDQFKDTVYDNVIVGCPHCSALHFGIADSDEAAHALSMQLVEEMLGQHGLIIAHVPAYDGYPSITYTIGLQKAGFREVFMQGLPPESACSAINRYHTELLAGSLKSQPVMLDDYFTLPVAVIATDEEQGADFIALAKEYGELTGIEADAPLQWVFSDKFGVLPWEPGFTAHFRQVIVNRNPVTPGRMVA